MKGLEKVLSSLETALRLGICLKINIVAMKGVNDDEIQEFVKFARDHPIEVRFIEYMPFDGEDSQV